MCPVCHEPLRDVEPAPDELLDVDGIGADGEDISLDVDLPPDEQADADDQQDEASAETKRQIALAITIVSIAALIIAGIVLTNIFSPRPAGDDSSKIRKDRLASVPPEPPTIDEKSAVRPDVKPEGKPDIKPEVAPDVKARRDRHARRLVDPQDVGEAIIDVPPDQELNEFGEKIEIDAPQGEHAVDAVRGRDAIQLTGKVKKLTIAGVHGQGSLITEKLAAEEVIITGAVNEAGALKLDVPGGSVTFLSSLDGAARVRVNASGGKVTFGPADKSRHGGGVIVGSAHVTIIARDVDIKGIVDGGARVMVTLTEGGSLRFSRIAGGAHLHYRKAKPGDPDPKIEPGQVLAGGKFECLEPPKPPAPSPKIELDLTKLDAKGLRGPPNGKVSVSYEFCIPNTAKCKAAVKAIDPKVRFMPGSRGRIGAGKNECLCVGETRADFRTVLKRLADLPYIKRIIECHWE
jgi:hypothetical protein